MFPIRDENRSQTTPHVTRVLILANIILFIPFLYAAFSSEDSAVLLFAESLFYNFTMVPADVLQARNLYALLTSMFLHVDIFHISGNMLFLYVFGDNVEDAFGHFRYLMFYLLCGLVADFAHVLSLTTPTELAIPTLGASGAISGVMGAYVLLYPRARIRTLILVYFVAVVSVPAVFFLGFWFLLQLLYTWLDMGGGVAYWAHIGGFVAGMVLALTVRRKRKVRRLPMSYYAET